MNTPFRRRSTQQQDLRASYYNSSTTNDHNNVDHAPETDRVVIHPFIELYCDINAIFKLLSDVFLPFIVEVEFVEKLFELLEFVGKKTEFAFVLLRFGFECEIFDELIELSFCCIYT